MGFRRCQGNQLGLRRRQIDRLPAVRSGHFYDLSGAGEMNGASQPAPSPFAAMLLTTAKRLGTSVLPFVVVILLWQFASLFFPRFLFPSLIDVFWRCLQIFSDGAMFSDVLATVLRILGGRAGAFCVGGVVVCFV